MIQENNIVFKDRQVAGKGILLLIALIIMLNASAFSQYLTSIYYGVLVITSLYIFFCNFWYKDDKYDIKSLFFLFVGIFSLLLNDVDPRFNAWQRLAGFSMLLLAFGPLSKSNYSINFKIQLFEGFKILIVLFTLLSLVSFLLSFPFAFYGGVSGFFNHSMMLSPMAALSSLICLDKLRQNPSISFRRNILYVVLFTISLFMCVIAASRGAIGGLIISLLVYLLIFHRFKINKLFTPVVILIFLVAIVIMYNPGNVLDNVIIKLNKEAYLSGRDVMWKDRIADFKDSPLIGVGFGTMKEIENSKVNFSEGGGVEPGSGWLMILGSMGAIGFILAALLILTPIIKSRLKPEYSLLIAIICFFIIHSFIEGYVISFGSTLSVLLWLTVANLDGIIFRERII